MKKTIYLLLLMAAVLLTACHSSEQNYREAYEKAMERRQTGVGAEAYAKIEAERQRYTHVINGDSVRLVHVNANVAIDSTAIVKPYNVVVASFTQRINAKSYRERLQEECGLKDSYILYGGNDKQYYVVARGFDTSGDAAAMIRDIEQYLCIKILEPIPWILKKV
ncbi:MAG: SPOR domain-containing protein [Muribaculaceae bacterium]|nr:SPOR domain-containing protein [Muribaculaceae bacterium]